MDDSSTTAASVVSVITLSIPIALVSTLLDALAMTSVSITSIPLLDERFTPVSPSPIPATNSVLVHTRLGKSVDVSAVMIFADTAVSTVGFASKVADMALVRMSSSAKTGALEAS